MRRSYREETDHSPLGYWGQTPVYAVTLVVVAHAAAFILSALLVGLGAGWILERLAFHSGAALGRFELWRFLTYAIVKPEVLSLFGAIMFVFELLILYQFGRELETYFGRRAFLLLYATLWLSIPLALALASPLLGTVALADSWPIHFAVFVAFATLYPNALVFLGLPARIVAPAFLALVALISFASGRWENMIAYATSSGLAHLMIRQLGVGEPLSLNRAIAAMLAPLRRRARRPRLRVLPHPRPHPPEPPEPREARERPETEPDAARIDAILEKISRKGIASLTREERAALERARSSLLRRDHEDP